MYKPDEKTVRAAIDKECPFCGGDTYSHTIHGVHKTHSVTCTSCWASTGEYATWEEAAEAWNTRAALPEEEANELVTREELREMDGQAVWVSYPYDLGGEYAIVNAAEEKLGIYAGFLDFKDIGEDAAVYRRKVEEEHRGVD